MSRLKKLIKFDDKIFVAGHNGMVGSAIYRKLKRYQNIIIITKERKELSPGP